MTRFLLAGGASAGLMGLGMVVPVFAERLEQGVFSNVALGVLSLAGVLVVCGAAGILAGLLRWKGVTMPAPVRAVVMAHILFLAFCALEMSDGLVRREGRIFYWTTVLFVPALLLLTGVLLARCWAWWTARGVSAIFILWFVGFIAMIPFANLRGSEGPVPWWGRVYMMGVTLIFASVAAYVFLALGRSETKAYFGMRLEERTIPEAAK